jgi:murein DD-endopeptidase MepM/ murein hydrolase activator NlpD
MKRARLFLSALFFLCGLASFASLSWIQKYQAQALWKAEPYFRSPIPLFSNRALLRNDAFGKGKFGASRGNGKRTHKGIDLLVGVGRGIIASKSGRVSAAAIDKGYGWYVEILHPDGRRSRYAHLGRIRVQQGQWVAAGEPIGECGKSGNARDPRIRPHLHFEIREGGEAVDPLKFLDPSILVR